MFFPNQACLWGSYSNERISVRVRREGGSPVTQGPVPPKILVPRSWYLDLGTKIESGTKILVPKSWYQNLGTKILVLGSWYQDLGTKDLGTRDLGTKIFGGTGPCMTGEPPSRRPLTDILSLL